MADRPPGARGFDETYWSTNYAEPHRMDGIGNAEAHARFLKASFDVVLEEPSSVVDLGFGLGHLFEAVLHAFQPYKAVGIDASPVAHAAVARRVVPPARTKLSWEQVDLATWCARPDHPKRRFDLGVCTSVLQYLSDDEVEAVVPVLAQRVKWLYLTVPTSTELVWQRTREDFVDAWAHDRPRAFYRDAIAPHFVGVGARLLESRVLVDEADSPFTDHLYRDDGLP